MSELEHTKQRYGLRLTERFVVYDPEHGLHVFRDWAKDTVVTNPTEIAFLEFRDAPTERIEIN